MSAIKDGGPAFPSANDVRIGNMGTSGHAGMTLRDYFAAKAMAGDWASQSLKMWAFSLTTTDEQFFNSAVMYYRMADAMLKAREVAP